MQTPLDHLLKIQSEVETAKRPVKDYLTVLGVVVHTFLQRTARLRQYAFSLRDVRNGLTIANSIELVLSANKLAPEEESDVRELLNAVHARIAELTLNSAVVA